MSAEHIEVELKETEALLGDIDMLLWKKTPEVCNVACNDYQPTKGESMMPVRMASM